MLSQLKLIILYIINIGIGYLSMRYVLLSITIAGNINGKGYYDPEAESLRFIGYMMLLIWCVLVVLVNIGLTKILRGHVREEIRLIYQKKIQWKNFLYQYFFVFLSLFIGCVFKYFILWRQLQ